MKIKIIKGEATTLELILMIILALYYIQDTLWFNQETWFNSLSFDQVNFRRFFAARIHPNALQCIEFSIGILLLLAVIWNIYKRYKIKRH